MIDRRPDGLRTSNSDVRLRYKPRSSVYSRRTIDGLQPAAPVTPKVTTQSSATQAVPSVQTTHSPLVGKGVNRDVWVPRQKTAVPSLPRQQYREIPVPEVEPKQKRTLRQLLNKNNALVGMAAAVFLLGIGVSFHSFLTNKHVTQQVQALSNDSKQQNSGDEGTSGDEKPDETPVSLNAIGGYKVAPDLPQRLIIKKIGVSARIKPLGVSRDNQLLAPSSIYDAGWYNASAKPGVDAGAVLIDGHVHGPTKPGIFNSLKKLVVGDMIEVQRGDGKIIHYKVQKTEAAPADGLDMAKLMSSAQPGKQGLNLITCGGKYDAKAGHYEDRDIVYAVQVD